MTRDGEVKQRQHFCHHGDTICHPKSGYVTTKMHGTSTCRCSNNAIFSDKAIFKFPASTYAGRVKVCPTYPQNVKKSKKIVSCVCFLHFSIMYYYDQNTVIIYVNLMPNYFSQYCMLGCL